MLTKHCIKRKLILSSTLPFGNISFPAFAPLGVFQLTEFYHPLLPDLFPSRCHFLSLSHVKGAWVIVKPLNTASLCSFSLCTPILGSSSGGQSFFNVFVVVCSPMYIECKSHPGWCCSVQNIYKKSIAQLGWKKTFSLQCIFLCLGPHISVVTDADHPDPTANWLSQLQWEWTIDTESLSDFEHCSYKPPSQGLPYSSLERPESLLFNWVALIIVWLHARGLFLFRGAKQEEMVRVLFTPLAEGTPYRTGQQHKTASLQALTSR